MNELFGTPMSGIAVALTALLALCLLTVIVIAARKPIVFKMGLRNIPRRKAQTALIIIGLMLSTMIVSAALGVGDTLDSSVRNTAYRQLGPIDQVIVSSATSATNRLTGAPFDEAKFTDVAARLSTIPEIDGLLPSYTSQVAAVNDAGGLANSQVIITGVDTTRIGPFSGFTSPDGDRIDIGSFPSGTVVVSEALSTDLALAVGETFTIYMSGKPTTLTVGGISTNNQLIGVINDDDGSINQSAIAMPLDQAQNLLGVTGQLNQIFVSQTGPIAQNQDDIIAVTDKAGPLLDGTGLGIYDIKADYLQIAENLSSGFTSIFIVLGLFSIAAGILLIVLIFSMLAAERRSEMGMARAVGQRRLQLVQQFISEGAGYALLAGIVGAGLGVGATYLMARMLDSLFGDGFAIVAYVSGTSLISAYALGVFITFATVIASSWKVSRVNIVAAIRDIPESARSKGRIRKLIWSVVLLAVGAIFLLAGIDSATAFPFYSGISLLPFGVALLFQFFGVPGRLLFSLVAVWLLAIWMMPFNWFERIFGVYEGDVEMFFLSGIFLVLASTILIVQNTTLLLNLVTRIGSRFRSKLGSVKLAVAYPGHARGRTGLAIAMFSLIIFSLVMMATIAQNISAAFLNDRSLAGWDVKAETNTGQPVADFPSRLASASIDPSQIERFGTVTQPIGDSASMQQIGPVTGKSGSYDLFAMDPTFLQTTEWKFEFRATGYESDQAIVDALKTDPSLVVIDSSVVWGDDFGNDVNLSLTGIDEDNSTFAPITVSIGNADGIGTTTVRIIGVIHEENQILLGMFGSTLGLAAAIGPNGTDTYYIQTAPGADSKLIARAIEGTVVRDGVKVTSLEQTLKDAQRITSGFFYLVEGFMGLGLVVGLAAVGVISFRSVVERRQQIGMLRALGFQKSMISLVFLIETGYIVLLGMIAGSSTGVILARNLLLDQEESQGIDLSAPYGLIGAILLGTVTIALLNAYIPSRQAAYIAPAAALRYE